MSQNNRHSLRLQGYDYSQSGAYFVTIVTQDRRNLFGEIQGGVISLSPSGEMIQDWWEKIENKFSSVSLDEFVVMPNHIHVIIILVGADPCVRPVMDPYVRPGFTDPSNQEGAHVGAPLPEIIQWFKTMTTNAYIRGVKQSGWSSFPGRVWQRNYYDHIIRNETDLDRVREYIQNNPLSWELDQENPKIR